jgi:hypothetical protein
VISSVIDLPKIRETEQLDRPDRRVPTGLLLTPEPKPVNRKIRHCSILRTLNGNDYGRDLRQLYEQSRHR